MIPFETVFHVFGINLVSSLTPNSTRSRIFQIINFSMIIFNTFLLIIQYEYPEEFYDYVFLIGMLADVVQTALPILCHIIILLVANLKKKVHRKLDQKMKDVLKGFQELPMDNKNNFHQTSASCFIFSIGLCFVIDGVTHKTVAPKQKAWSNSLMIRNLATFTNRLNEFQFLYYVLKLTSALKVINKNIFEAKSQYQKIHMLKISSKVLSDIWTATDLINKRFGFTLVCTVTCNIVAYIISLYWIIRHTYFGVFASQGLEHILASISVASPPIVTLLVLFYACSNCGYQVRQHI